MSERGPSVWSELKPTVRRIKIELRLLNIERHLCEEGPLYLYTIPWIHRSLWFGDRSSRTYTLRALNMIEILGLGVLDFPDRPCLGET